MRSILIRAFQWAIAGFLIGVLVWTVLGSLVWPVLFNDWSLGMAIRDFPSGALFVGSFAAFLGLVLLPIYFALFVAYEYFSKKYDWLYTTPPGLLTTVVLLAMPAALSVAVSLSYNSIDDEIVWSDFSISFLLAIITFGAAVLLPCLVVPQLRHNR